METEEIYTKKRIQFERRQHNQSELLKLRNHLTKEKYHNSTEMPKERNLQIVNGNKQRLFVGLANAYSKDVKELESLRLITAYYKDAGKGYYSESDIENIENIIECLKEGCVDAEWNLQETGSLKDNDDTCPKISDEIKIQNRLLMCHNIILAYCSGVLQNTPFRLHKNPSKKNIEISYKCNYKRDIFETNTKILSNFQCTRIVDRYKHLKSTASFRNAKFSNSIKMVSLEKTIGYNSAMLYSMNFFFLNNSHSLFKIINKF